MWLSWNNVGVIALPHPFFSFEEKKNNTFFYQGDKKNHNISQNSQNFDSHTKKEDIYIYIYIFQMNWKYIFFLLI